jgi:hypothetical protein
MAPVPEQRPDQKDQSAYGKRYRQHPACGDGVHGQRVTPVELSHG